MEDVPSNLPMLIFHNNSKINDCNTLYIAKWLLQSTSTKTAHFLHQKTSHPPFSSNNWKIETTRHFEIESPFHPSSAVSFSWPDVYFSRCHILCRRVKHVIKRTASHFWCPSTRGDWDWFERSDVSLGNHRNERSVTCNEDCTKWTGLLSSKFDMPTCQSLMGSSKGLTWVHTVAIDDYRSSTEKSY